MLEIGKTYKFVEPQMVKTRKCDFVTIEREMATNRYFGRCYTKLTKVNDKYIGCEPIPHSYTTESKREYAMLKPEMVQECTDLDVNYPNGGVI